MKTTYFTIDPNHLTSPETEAALHKITTALTDGEVVALPTETVYGLAADATNGQAIQNIFTAKGRPSDNPLIIHVHSEAQLSDFVPPLNDKVRMLIQRFWPGPLSLVLPLKPGVLSCVAVANLDTVAVRSPDHPVMQAVLKRFNRPLAAPSANTSGSPSPTEAAHVKRDLDGKIFGIVDSEPTRVGIESTVLDCTAEPYRILRPGTVTLTDLEAVLGANVIYDKNHEDFKSPGMRYPHYAPHQPVYVVTDWNKHKETIRHMENIAVIAPRTIQSVVGPDVVFLELCQDETDFTTAASRLYRSLREVDASQVEAVYIHGFEENTQSTALNNRIYKAAGENSMKD